MIPSWPRQVETYLYRILPNPGKLEHIFIGYFLTQARWNKLEHTSYSRLGIGVVFRSVFKLHDQRFFIFKRPTAIWNNYHIKKCLLYKFAFITLCKTNTFKKNVLKVIYIIKVTSYTQEYKFEIFWTSWLYSESFI